MSTSIKTKSSTTKPRCCSYCRETGHNVQRCNSEHFRTFEQMCLHQLQELGDTAFDRWFDGYVALHTQLVKSFAVRFCGMSMTTNLPRCIAIVSLHMKQTLRAELVERNNNNLLLYNRDELLLMMFADIVSLIQEEDEERAKRRFDLKATVASNETANDDTANDDTKKEEEEDEQCDICYENVNQAAFVSLTCGHKYCKTCMKSALRNVVLGRRPECAFCRSPVEEICVDNYAVREEFNDLLCL